jgi:hypothetical protein
LMNRRPNKSDDITPFDGTLGPYLIANNDASKNPSALAVRIRIIVAS